MTLNKQLITQVAGTEYDFEWYPTTDEIIQTVKNDMENMDRHWHQGPTVLDCGAGDGRVLLSLTKANKYAIEKSKPLLNALDKSIFVVGTEFNEQTLIDKKVDIVFSNPPYSEFEPWAVKIIREANASFIYLVIPDRWEKSQAIAQALESRRSKATVIGKFDFLGADRAARANVHVIRICSARFKNGIASNPFDLWFEDNFKLDINKEGRSKYYMASSTQASVKEKTQNELVNGSDLVQVLERLYQRDLAKLMQNYKSLETIDAELLKELDVNLNAVKEALQMKIVNLKDVYWKEFFERMEKITRRLTTKNRQHMLEKLTAHTHIDFSVSNAYALSIWAIKNANGYFDNQLIDTFERMIEQANIVNYKSNQRTFKAEQWRWHSRPEGLEKFGLEFRVVLERVGGIWNTSWEHERRQYGGLRSGAAEFLNDVRTIADNLGYSVEGYKAAEQFEWESNRKVIFYCKDRRTLKEKPLMEVRAFKNGNLHIKFDQDFMCRLNVEFGRLKGWIRSHEEASQELGIDAELAAESFASNLRLTSCAVALLGISNEDDPLAA